MKKYLPLKMVLIILLLCVSCTRKNEKIIDFNPNEVVNIEIYNIHGFSSKRKIITNKDDIKIIINALSTLKIKSNESNAELTEYGTILFIFNKLNHSQFTVSYNGMIILSSDNFGYEVNNKNNLFNIWEQMRYDEQKATGYESPFYPKN